MKKNKGFRRVAGLILGLGLFFSACSNGGAQEAGKSKERDQGKTLVKIGVVGAQQDLWKLVQTNLAKENIEIKLVEFSDYNIPNEALASGDLDLNSFQHHQFFNNYLKESGKDLVAIGDTFLSPIGLYSNKISKVEEIKEGATIAIPNDPTNEGRALQVLAQAKLITLDRQDGWANVKNIKSNPKNLKITPLDAAQTAQSLQDVEAAIVNTDLAIDAGLKVEDAIFREKVSEETKAYINLIAARAQDKDHPVFQKIVAAYQSEAVAQKMKEIYKGAQVPAWK